MKKAPFVGEIAREMRLGETMNAHCTSSQQLPQTLLASVNRDSSYLIIDDKISRERERGRCLASPKIITHR